MHCVMHCAMHCVMHCVMHYAMQVVREPPEVKSWIICDGDIDPEWVESLNSVP